MFTMSSPVTGGLQRCRTAFLGPQRGAAVHRHHFTVCAATHKVTLLPGDGIGPEITQAAVKVLTAAGKAEGDDFVFTEALIGGAAIDATGDPYPDETLQKCKESDAVLLAAIGG
jgi:isocitrate dehydrogenase